MKKLICLLLCILMLTSALLVSCAKEDDNQSSAPDTGSSTSVEDVSKENSNETSADDRYTDSEGKYVNKNLPPFDSAWLDYGEFRVLVYNKEAQDTYFSEEIEAPYDTTDAKLKEGVDERNTWIKENYGITIKAVAVKDVLTTFRQEALSGTYSFDVAMPFMAAAATLAREGYLYDLREFSDYIDLEAPWWDQNATQSLSINNRVFFTTGDISIMQRIVSGGVAFNRKLVADYFPDVNMYELVDSGKWTLDKFYQMSKTFTRQGDDDEKMDENDFWGCMGGGIGFYYGAGESLMAKDENDIPIIHIGDDERSLTVAQKVLELLGEKGTWYITANDFTNQTDKWAKTVEIFGTDKALFMTFAFSAIKKYRAYDVEFGIVPVPKFNENQDYYYTSCTANMAYGICIPTFVEDKDFAAYMVELLAVGGKNYITNSYYNSILKGKDLKLEDDERMLDLIFSNIIYDVALVYQFAGLNNVFTNANKDNLISHLDTIRSGVLDAIEEVVDSYRD